MKPSTELVRDRSGHYGCVAQLVKALVCLFKLFTSFQTYNPLFWISEWLGERKPYNSVKSLINVQKKKEKSKLGCTQRLYTSLAS